MDRPDDYQRAVAAIEARTALLGMEAAALVEAAGGNREYADAVEFARSKAEILYEAQQAGMQITPELEASVDRLAGAYVEAGIAARDAEAGLRASEDQMEQIKTLSKDVFGGMFEDLRDGASAADVLANALNRVAESLVKSGIDRLIEGAFAGGGARAGGLLGGMIIPGILHGGGIAGRDGYGHGRSIAASAFDDAPRYHKGGIAGLRPNEVPAILERGEMVIPKGAQASAPQEIKVHVTVGGSVDENGTLATYVQNVAVTGARATVETAMREQQRALPDNVARANAKPWRR